MGFGECDVDQNVYNAVSIHFGMKFEELHLQNPTRTAAGHPHR